MGFTEEYLALREKRKKKKIEEETKKVSTSDSFSKEYAKLRAERIAEEEDIAPVRSSASNVGYSTSAPISVGTSKRDEDEEEDNGKLDFFKKSKGNIAQTILGTAGDAIVDVTKGVFSLGEGLVDLASYGVAGVADLVGADEFADDLKRVTAKSQTDYMFGDASEFLDDYSVLGRTSDAILQGVGQVGGIIATGGLGTAARLGTIGTTALTTGTIGLSGVGSGMGEAYESGATDGEAFTYGLLQGSVEAGTELLFGGLGKAVKALGISRGLSSLDDVFAAKLSSKISNNVAKTLVQAGVKATGEGFEEWLSGALSAVAKKLTYMSDEELSKLVEDENLLEQFVVGTVTSGIAQGGDVKTSIKTGQDFISGLTENEQKVVDKVYQDTIAEAEKDGKKLTNKEKSKIYDEVMEDFESGAITIDEIESALGGETYNTYKDTIDSEDAKIFELDKQIKELESAQNTVGNAKKYDALTAQLDELKANSKRDQLKSQLRDEVFNLAKDSRLVESYNEQSRRGQAYEADISKYDAKQQKIIQNAIDSGILNNTRKTHKFVDMIAKISADKGVSFDFTDNARLKESGFSVDGGTINGYVNKDGVTINIESSKSLNSVAGHEITHVLEGTELYAELQNTIFEYAKSKGEYDSRLAAITELYKSVEGADVNAELTADLVGDYLFTDADFVRKLSAEHRNVFQKIYDEVKYLLKVATAGSEEARELEKVKKVFEDAYRGETKNTVTNDGVRLSLTMDMTETERYNELKDKTLYVVESADQSQYQEKLDSIDSMPPKAKSKVEKEIYALAEELGILRTPMTTPDIKFDFQITKTNGLKKSLNNQLDYGGSYGDFARALINLDKIITNAVLVDAYTQDRYANTSRANDRFEGGYVLLGAFQDSENIIPVKLTIKKDAGRDGNLYVVVAMTKIKRTSVMGSKSATHNSVEPSLPVTGSTYSLQQIISNVNTADADFLKYLPDANT